MGDGSVAAEIQHGGDDGETKMIAEEEQPQATRRIVVALDASACGRAALDAATQLAVEMQAELQGLFVEDVDLLRLANLPFASEVPLPYAVPRQLDAASIQCAFRAHAEKVRHALAEAADRLRLRWSFQVLQGDVVRTSRAVAEEAELLILGWAETAASGSSHGAQRKPVAAAGLIVVIDEGSPSSDRVLRAAVDNRPGAIGRVAGAQSGGGSRRGSVAAAPDRRVPAAAAESGTRSSPCPHWTPVRSSGWRSGCGAGCWCCGVMYSASRNWTSWSSNSNARWRWCPEDGERLTREATQPLG